MRLFRSDGWMQTLVLIGDDLAQVMELAAAMRTSFQSVRIVHDDNVVERVREECQRPEQSVLVCLSQPNPHAPGPFEAFAATAFVLRDSQAMEAFRSAGFRCFDAALPAVAIAAAITTRVSPRPKGGWRPSRHWTTWPARSVSPAASAPRARGVHH
jgi:hypothetical protein